MTTAPARVGSALAYQAPGAGSSSATFAKASLPTLAVGDVLVAAVGHRAATAGTWPTVPTGFTLLASNTLNHQWGIWYHVITDSTDLAGLPTTFTFTNSNTASRMAGAMLVLRGVNPLAPVDVLGTVTGQASASAIAYADMNTVHDNVLAQYFAFAVQQTTNAGVTINPDGSLTEVYEFVGGTPTTAASYVVEMASVTKGAHGAMGAKTDAASGSPNFTNMGGVAVAWAPIPDANTAPTVTAPDAIVGVEPGDPVDLVFVEADADANIDTSTRTFRIISATNTGETVSWSRTGTTVTVTAPNNVGGCVINYGYKVQDTEGLWSTEATGSITVLTNTRVINMGAGVVKPISRVLNQ